MQDEMKIIGDLQFNDLTVSNLTARNLFNMTD